MHRTMQRRARQRAQGAGFAGMNVEQEHIPLLAKEGWPRHQEDDAEGHQSWRGRGGQSLKHLISNDHPVCADKERELFS